MDNEGWIMNANQGLKNRLFQLLIRKINEY